MKKFPKPFLITTGMTKGGAGKTWVSLNLGSYLGRKGYRVLVIDMNPTNDAEKDVTVMRERGEEAYIHVCHDPEAGRAGGAYERFAQSYDFVIADTFQYLEVLDTKWAWENCDLMIFPVTSDHSDSNRFQACLTYFSRVRGNNYCPLITLPVRTDVLVNAPAMRHFTELLNRFKTVGAEVPDFPPSFFLDNNLSMKNLDVRLVHSRYGGQGVSEKFMTKVELNFAWVFNAIMSKYDQVPEAWGYCSSLATSTAIAA